MLGRAARRLLIVVALLYSIGVVALVALWAAWPRHPWWLALSNVFAAHLFAPLLVLVPLALLVRSRYLRMIVALPLLLFLGQFGARLIPSAAPPVAGTGLRVMTLNQWYPNQHIDLLIDAIRAQDADVVALQELSLPVAVALQEQLSEDYPYQFVVPAELDYGLGLLSRYPIQAQEREPGFLGQRVVLDVHGTAVTLINVHLPAPSVRTRRLPSWRGIRLPLIDDYNTSRRTDELAGLLMALDQVEGPLVVLGDFNTGDREPGYRALSARLTDAYRATAWGFGFSFPNHRRVGRFVVPFPLVRIDYVWSRDGVAPAAAQVDCRETGSDHCMVVADLRVGAAAPAAQLLPTCVQIDNQGQGQCGGNALHRNLLPPVFSGGTPVAMKGGGSPW